VFATTGPELFGLNVIGLIGFLLASILGIWVVYGVIRSGRL
jgi:hypothetical protein